MASRIDWQVSIKTAVQRKKLIEYFAHIYAVVRLNEIANGSDVFHPQELYWLVPVFFCSFSAYDFLFLVYLSVLSLPLFLTFYLCGILCRWLEHATAFE